MPEFRLPTTAEEWAAVEPNETDVALANQRWKYPLGLGIDTQHSLTAAASRLLERERCVERLAEHTEGGAAKIIWSSDGTREARIKWARRILEDAK